MVFGIGYHWCRSHNPVKLVNIVFREWEQLYQEKPLKQMIEEARYMVGLATITVLK